MYFRKKQINKNKDTWPYFPRSRSMWPIYAYYPLDWTYMYRWLDTSLWCFNYILDFSFFICFILVMSTLKYIGCCSRWWSFSFCCIYFSLLIYPIFSYFQSHLIFLQGVETFCYCSSSLCNSADLQPLPPTLALPLLLLVLLKYNV